MPRLRAQFLPRQMTDTVQASDWRRWEIETKQKMTSVELGMSDLLLLAYTSVKRTSDKPVKPLDAWCDGVADVEVVDGNCKPHASGSLNRLVVELAIATQIPMQYWETAEDILTALEILKDRNGRSGSESNTTKPRPSKSLRAFKAMDDEAVAQSKKDGFELAQIRS
jgi:hypothetical protein